jgi:hypothetical protein
MNCGLSNFPYLKPRVEPRSPKDTTPVITPEMDRCRKLIPPKSPLQQLRGEFTRIGQTLDDCAGGYCVRFGSRFGINATLKDFGEVRWLVKYFAPTMARSSNRPADGGAGYRIGLNNGELTIEVKNLKEAEALLAIFREGVESA